MGTLYRVYHYKPYGARSTISMGQIGAILSMARRAILKEAEGQFSIEARYEESEAENAGKLKQIVEKSITVEAAANKIRALVNTSRKYVDQLEDDVEEYLTQANEAQAKNDTAAYDEAMMNANLTGQQLAQARQELVDLEQEANDVANSSGISLRLMTRTQGDLARAEVKHERQIARAEVGSQQELVARMQMDILGLIPGAESSTEQRADRDVDRIANRGKAATTVVAALMAEHDARDRVNRTRASREGRVIVEEIRQRMLGANAPTEALPTPTTSASAQR